MSVTGDDLRRLREKRGWSQNDLGDALNVALNTNYKSGSVSPWESGKRPIPASVAAFIEELLVDANLPADQPEIEPAPREEDEPPADTPPGPGSAATQPQAAVGGGVWVRACTELWEMIATGVGMVGAATGNEALVLDGQIIAGDKDALGAAWGKLAETNETFRKMLVGMTEGGAWLQVALVTGTTVSRCYQNHALRALQPPGQPPDEPAVPYAA